MLTKFALRASEVIFDSEVHFVSEVSPNGEVMGKFNFTASVSYVTSLCITQLHFCGSENFTNRKRADTQDFSFCVFALSVCYKGLGLALSRLTSQMRCSHLHLVELLNSPLRIHRYSVLFFFLLISS